MNRFAQFMFPVCASFALFACDAEPPSGATDSPDEAAEPEVTPPSDYALVPLKNMGWSDPVEGVDLEALTEREGITSGHQIHWAELTGEAPAELVLVQNLDDASGVMRVYDVRDASAPKALSAPVLLDRTEPAVTRRKLPYGPYPQASDLDGDGASELVLAGFERGEATLRVYGVEAGALVLQVDVETKGHLHVPFDHDGDGARELVALTTSKPEDVRGDASVEVELIDPRTGEAHASKVPLEVWLPRFFTYTIVSEGISGITLVLVTTAMRSRDLLPYDPDAAFAGAFKGMTRKPRGMFDLHDPSFYSNMLYWPRDEASQGKLVEIARSDTHASGLALEALLSPDARESDRMVGLRIMREKLLAPRNHGLPSELIRSLPDGEHGELCDALTARIRDEGVSDSERDRLALRGVGAQADCVGFALEVMEAPEAHTSTRLKLALNGFNPKLASSRRTRSVSEEARGTRAAIALLGHEDPEVRGSAALVLTWREGGEDALAAALAKEADEDARGTMKAALARKSAE